MNDFDNRLKYLVLIKALLIWENELYGEMKKGDSKSFDVNVWMIGIKEW